MEKNNRKEISVAAVLSQGQHTELNVDDIKKKMPDIEDFQFLKPISRGAFGKVFLGCKKDNRNVMLAIKVVKKSDIVNKNMVEQVITERDALARTKSPFCVQLFYSLQTASNVYLVMEYLIGGDLKSLLTIYGYFDEPMAVFYAAELALALDHLHSHGIVHRDVKPDNLLLDNRGHLKLTDFGLSKITLHKELNVADLTSLTPRTSSGLSYVRTPGQLLSLTSHLSFSSEDGSTTIGSEVSVMNAHCPSKCSQLTTRNSSSKPCSYEEDGTPQNVQKIKRKRSSCLANFHQEKSLHSDCKENLQDIGESPVFPNSANARTCFQSNVHTPPNTARVNEHPSDKLFGSSFSSPPTTFKLKSPVRSPQPRDGDTSSEFNLSGLSEQDKESGIHPFNTPGENSVGELKNCSFEDKHDDAVAASVAFEFSDSLSHSTSNSFLQSSSPKTVLSMHPSGNLSPLGSDRIDSDTEGDLDDTRNLDSFDRSPVIETKLKCNEDNLGDTFIEKLHPRLKALSQLTDHMSPVGEPIVTTVASLVLGKRSSSDIATSSPIPTKDGSDVLGSLAADELQREALSQKTKCAVHTIITSTEEPQHKLDSRPRKEAFSFTDELIVYGGCLNQNFKIPCNSRGLKRPHSTSCSPSGPESVVKSGLTSEIADICIKVNPKKKQAMHRTPLRDIKNVTDSSCFTPKRKYSDATKSLDLSRTDKSSSACSVMRGETTESEVFSPTADFLTFGSFSNKLCRWYSESDAIADPSQQSEGDSVETELPSSTTTQHQSSNHPFSSFHTPARLPSIPTTPLQRVMGQTPLRRPKSVRRGAPPQSDSYSRILGTPDYLAPELLLKLGHGPAVDWWALGVCLFEFMTGIPPFNDETPDAVFHNILQRDIPWPTSEEALSTLSVEVIDALLSFDPKARPDMCGLKILKLFHNTDWTNLRDSPAPFEPKPDDAMDTTYFEARNNIQNLTVSNFDL